MSSILPSRAIHWASLKKRIAIKFKFIICTVAAAAAVNCMDLHYSAQKLDSRMKFN
jgi:hypothetical protein